MGTYERMTTKNDPGMCFIKYYSVRSDQLAQEMTDDEECKVKDRRKRERERGAGVATGEV